MKMTPQQYCLRWKHHHTNVQNMFAQLLEKERFCDVTLYCSPSFATQVPNNDTVDPAHVRGVSLRAHRVVLASCSELLGSLLGAHEAQGEPVLVIDGAEPGHLRALLDYMYTGEMNVHHSQLAALLKTAEELRIKGLTDIRWNNKDEPPDSETGIVTTTTTSIKRQSRSPDNKPEPKNSDTLAVEPISAADQISAELRAYMKKEDDDKGEKFNVNGGPPPLIKLPVKEKGSPIKREYSDTDTPSPKRQRVTSANEHTDDENSYSAKCDRNSEDWKHGNLDISAERVVGWGMGGSESGEWSRDASDDEWADAPADIGSFLQTKLRVDEDNSADEESSNECSTSAPVPTSTSSSASRDGNMASAGISVADIKVDLLHAPVMTKQTVGPKSGPTDPRFNDVVKLNDYLQHGRRPQFWEESYVKRVMEAVRLKELEMKQAAEILGVSYGTLYGRYRDVYGCINRPYRTARDFWQAKGPSEVLDRLQRGEISLEAASQALGVTPSNLAAYVADAISSNNVEKEFEPIPIEIDPSLKMKPRAPPANPNVKPRFKTMPPTADKSMRKILVGSIEDEDTIPVTVIATQEVKGPFTAPPTTTSATGKWPTIRVASLETLRADPSVSAPPTSPTQLMRTRPDLTIVAAKKPDSKRDDDST